jgi:hypothetical protein
VGHIWGPRTYIGAKSVQGMSLLLLPLQVSPQISRPNVWRPQRSSLFGDRRSQVGRAAVGVGPVVRCAKTRNCTRGKPFLMFNKKVFEV